MGYTAHATNPLFNPNLPYDTLKDLAAIAYVCYIPLVLDVHPSVPVNSVQELIALARAKPGELKYASPKFSTAAGAPREKALEGVVDHLIAETVATDPAK